MPRFYIELDLPGHTPVETGFADVGTARNAALVMLATELASNPSYAAAGHWRADLRDANRRLVANVIVATVAASPNISWASFEKRDGSR